MFYEWSTHNKTKTVPEPIKISAHNSILCKNYSAKIKPCAKNMPNSTWLISTTLINFYTPIILIKNNNLLNLIQCIIKKNIQNFFDLYNNSVNSQWGSKILGYIFLLRHLKITIEFIYLIKIFHILDQKY